MLNIAYGTLQGAVSIATKHIPTGGGGKGARAVGATVPRYAARPPRFHDKTEVYELFARLSLFFTAP